MNIKSVFFISFLLILSGTCMAQAKLSLKEKKARKDSIKRYKIKNGKTIISPVGAPIYTPEYSFMLAGGVLVSFRSKPSDSTLRRSFFPLTAGISTTGALIFQSKLTSFWKSNKVQINGDFILRFMPDHYWGVGYKAAQEIHRSDSTTSYKKQWLMLTPEFNLQIKKNYFIGLGIDVNYTEMKDLSPIHYSDKYILEFGEKNFNAGLGIVLKYDTRDVPINAFKGTLIKINSYYYGSYLYSDNEYSTFQLDFRQFFSFSENKKTVAIQFKSRASIGHIPYGAMSMVGSPFDLRGYYWGQYRDRNMAYGLLEYRHRFRKIQTNEVSKIGAVIWAGTGSVAPTLSQFKYWMPNVGIGLRYELQPRMNLRLDYGVGYHSTGFYFNFSEAF